MRAPRRSSLGPDIYKCDVRGSAAWNQAELSEKIVLSIDVDAEFQSVVNGYVAQKDTFAKIRAQFRPAAWNQAELSEEIDLSIDVDGEFQSQTAVNGYVAQNTTHATFANIRAANQGHLNRRCDGLAAEILQSRFRNQI
jgi:hypothetical protein